MIAQWLRRSPIAEDPTVRWQFEPAVDDYIDRGWEGRGSRSAGNPPNAVASRWRHRSTIPAPPPAAGTVCKEAAVSSPQRRGLATQPPSSLSVLPDPPTPFDGKQGTQSEGGREIGARDEGGRFRSRLAPLTASHAISVVFRRYYRNHVVRNFTPSRSE